ncbi:MAG: hypothetical protein K6E86_09300 [Bacteroidales bacterium]|nr:hypothetical protein [Bacteroidales bacterium]
MSDATLKKEYGEKWAQKKESLDQACINRMNTLMSKFNYNASKDPSNFDYLLRIKYIEIGLDAEILVFVQVIDNTNGTPKSIKNVKFHTDSYDDADTYIEISDESFIDLGEKIYNHIISPLIAFDKSPNTKRGYTKSRLLPEMRFSYDWWRSTRINKGINFEVAFCYEWLPRFSAGPGIGIGAHHYEYGDCKSYFEIPVFLQARYEILDKRVSPYLIGQVGYTFGDIEYQGWYDPWFDTQFKQGFFCQGGIGVKCRLKRGTIFTDASYRIQQWNTNRKARNMVSISVGYRLKFDL